MRRSCTVVKQGELIKHPVSNSFGPLSRPRLRLIVLRPDALEWHKGVATGKPEGSLPITGETTLRVDSTQLRVSTPGRQGPSVLLLEIEGGSGWATLREWATAVLETVKLVAIVEASEQEPGASTWPLLEVSQKSPRFTSRLRQYNTANDQHGEGGGTLEARGSSGTPLSRQGGSECLNGDPEVVGAPRADRLTSLEVELKELLGKGSYGMVYRGLTPRHGSVAVKVLPWALNEVSSELKKELKLLQRCNSAYIVRAFGAFAKPKELWIVMEYCDLGSLLDVMRSMDEPLPEAAIAAACSDSLRGLSYMHTQKRGIIHRDIKSANILLNSEGRVKLADFGVAAQLNSTASKRNTVIGTPHWMSPEVISNGKYDARADVWSLGITAIELAQGRPPHHAMRPVLKVLFAIVSGEPPQLDAPDDFSELFCDFLSAALTKDTEQRPTSGELLQHPFLAAAQRSALLNLAERALYYKNNPKPRAKSGEDATLRRSESDATLRRDDGTLQQDDGTMANGGGTCCTGDTESGTFCARATGCGTFCAAGSTAGGTFCPAHPQGGAGAASVEMLGTLRAGASRPRCDAVSTGDYSMMPPIYPATRMTRGGSMDDSQLNLSRLTRARFTESEGEGAPPRLIRAASDDALFERAVGRFDAPKGKSQPPFTSTGGEALPGETPWGEMNPWGDAKANCTIS